MKHLFLTAFVLLFFVSSIVCAEDQDRSKWPTKLVHPDMPAYKAGKLKGWNYWDKKDESSIFMLIDGTNQSDLDKYISQLEAAGFEKAGSKKYHKGLYDIGLQFNTDTILQISSTRIKTLEWPKAFLAGIPELKKGALTNMITPTNDMPDYVQLYFINLSQAELDAWLADLGAAGFTIDGGSATKANMKLKDKTYKSLYIQPGENGMNEWTLDFNYSD
jgi:hypothetical protein